MTQWRRLSLIIIFGLLVTFAAFNFSRTIAESVPTTNPTISPQARELINQMHDAYASLKSLSITGDVKFDFDIDGVRSTDTAKFSGLYSANGQFRSEMVAGPTADAIAGNTGDKLYVFFPARNRYDIFDAPKPPIHLDSLGEDISDLVCQQDMSLALALSSDPAATLSRNAGSIVRAKDVQIDGHACSAVAISGPQTDLTLIIDPTTHLLRRSLNDQTKLAIADGASVVKSALLTTDYVNTSGAPASADAFAWTPPPGAQPNASSNMGMALEGKPAPALALEGLDGKTVSNKSLKGSVYVLDFWASWCGTCVATLPNLEAVYKDFNERGVRFYAVNVQEDKPTIEKFIRDSKLAIPVLLDSDGKATESYNIEGIPFTVVVGKDGKVLKAGFIPDEDEIRPILEQALTK
jgi:thiol-disulfide isomerase/thioredoxin